VIGMAGDPFGDPDRIFISVVSDQDLTPVAPTPAPVDSPEATDSDKEKQDVALEPIPELLAKESQEPTTEFNRTEIDEVSDIESRDKEQEKKKEEQEKSSASNPQVASSALTRRAALGSSLHDFESLLLAAIKQSVFFPREALKERRHGQVIVAFTIDKDRRLSSIEVTSSSGCKILDKAAVEIIRKASEKFPSLPASLNRDNLSYTVPIHFKEKKN